MSEMQSVKHTERQHRGRLDVAVIYVTKDFHRIDVAHAASLRLGSRGRDSIENPTAASWQRALLNLNYQSIISDLNILWQMLARIRMLNVMRDVGQKRAARFEPFNVLE